MSYADLAGGQGWREAQNKMDIVVVRSRFVEVVFDISSVYEDMKERKKEVEEKHCPYFPQTPDKCGNEISGDTFLYQCMCLQFLV